MTPSRWHCAATLHMPASPPRRSFFMSDRFNLGPLPRLAYCDSVIDRAAHRRNEGAALEADAVAYALAGESVVLKRAQNLIDPVFALDEARSLAAHREQVFLGLNGG